MATDGGNQQFSAARMTFNGCKTAVQMNWDWGWVWKSLVVKNADVGFNLVGDAGGGIVGSISFVDSTFSNIGKAAIIMTTPKDGSQATATGLILDNVNLGGKILDASGNQILGTGYHKHVSVCP
jgi:hypothetical protein